MGFYEDDRIRAKNKRFERQNKSSVDKSENKPFNFSLLIEALSVYQKLIDMGLSQQDIKKHIKDCSHFTDDKYRSDIYKCLERLMVSVNNEDSK